MTLPGQYAWLEKEPGPRILSEMLKVYGTKEVRGPRDNPTIAEWAESIGFQNFHDATPWCGLTMGYVCAQAGWEHAPRGNPLLATNWLLWGNGVSRGSEMLGDVLVFHRPSGGHVAMYVGEDAQAFHIIGGNQGDAVSIERKDKHMLLGARRCPWRVNQPANVRKIPMDANGTLAANDA